MEEISIRYMSPQGFRTIRLPWLPGMTVSMACKAARLSDPLFKHQTSPLRYARIVGRQRVRLSHMLRPGDLLKLNPTNRPFA